MTRPAAVSRPLLAFCLMLLAGPGLAQDDAAGSSSSTDAADASPALENQPALATCNDTCPPGSDYPTVVIADYVLGCMVANGNTYVALQQCSCSIDYIRARMSYQTYERASTVMQVQLDRGQRGLFYRDSNWAKNRVEELENLQAQSTLECF